MKKIIIGLSSTITLFSAFLLFSATKTYAEGRASASLLVATNVRGDNSRQATARFGFNTLIHNVLSWIGGIRVRLNNSDKLMVYNN